MRLLELEIENVRGIRHLVLKPGGGNFAIWGPNGSGKSAVVDAVDFLITGDIIRLRGKGSGSMSLKKHGPHIGYKPEEARVRAIIKLNGHDDPMEISRCMDYPSKLVCRDSDLVFLEPILELARRGHHALTRREILRYVASEGSTRAIDIQELLNISEIEKIRKTFVSVKNEFYKKLQFSEKAVHTAKCSVSDTLELRNFDSELILQKVNQYRAIFGSLPISVLTSSEIKKNLVLPSAVSARQTINVTQIKNCVLNLKQVLTPSSKEKIEKQDSELRTLLVEIRRDPHILRTLSEQELINLGIELIDETDNCPLCEKSWPVGELKPFLEHRQVTAVTAQQSKLRITELMRSMSEAIISPLTSVQNIIAVADLIELDEDVLVLQKWEKDIEKFHTILNAGIEKYPPENIKSEDILGFVAPMTMDATLDKVMLAVESKYPDATPEQDAWTTLTRLEENIKTLESAQLEFNRDELSYKRAATLTEKFELTRNLVLGSLYDQIRDRFVELYKILHEDDERNFNAIIKPYGASLEFEVDFYGTGIHPPQAFHSEGHQDSMGLCLYLALVERLTGWLLDLIILDDVVMSVDTAHRRKLCELLATEFPERQFLITTHDKTWFSQMKSVGLVKKNGAIEFYNWRVETGPQVNTETEIWDKINKDLEKNDVSAASAVLRHGSEEYFSTVCDVLQASVKFKLSSRWELGDLLPAAINQYRYLLKKAKNSANSWNRKDLVAELNEFNSTASKIFTRTNVEQWAVNENVHYNNWANFSSSDFQPVVDAFIDLFALFRCTNCGAMLSLSVKGMDLTNLRCQCGLVDWNLVEK